MKLPLLRSRQTTASLPAGLCASFANAQRHFHAVALARDLGGRPLSLSFLGTPLVLFRDDEHKPAALSDRCPHRGARLSDGRVINGRIACPYHDWRFDAQGRCTKGRAASCRPATAYEAREAHGLIWLRRAGADTRLPNLYTEGYAHTLNRAYQIDAPLVQVLENLVDVEHTGSVHWFLGGGPADVDDLRLKVEAHDHEVLVSSSLRQKPLPAALRAPLGIEPGDRYALRFRAGFSPVHFLYDFVWTNDSGTVERPQRIKVAVFLTPCGERQTAMFTVVHFRGPHWLRKAMSPLLGLVLDFEVGQDARVLSAMLPSDASEPPSLGRYDGAIGPSRKRLHTLYWGDEQHNLPARVGSQRVLST